MVNCYYVKVNRREWKYPWPNGQPTDWDNFPLNKEQDFRSFTKNKLYWKSLKIGNIIIGHSSYISTKIKGEDKFMPLPRISAIAIVTREEHYSDASESDRVTLKKVIELTPIKLTKDIIKKNKLSNAEPFRLGTNRYTITKLSNEDFQNIVKIIEEFNPSIKKELKKL
ncbi:TPA: hypothetical protein HA281_01830 [Candidatus Woesearchaeota archaeon]|nr:hypothetical protein [Candidatus Woesearchaeota archaeon]